jgi:hypothetical protein
VWSSWDLGKCRPSKSARGPLPGKGRTWRFWLGDIVGTWRYLVPFCLSISALQHVHGAHNGLLTCSPNWLNNLFLWTNTLSLSIFSLYPLKIGYKQVYLQWRLACAVSQCLWNLGMTAQNKSQHQPFSKHIRTINRNMKTYENMTI